MLSLKEYIIKHQIDYFIGIGPMIKILCNSLDGKINVKHFDNVIEAIPFIKSMIENNDLTPDRWSYYEEYLKNREVKKFRENDVQKQLDKVVVEAVKTGEIRQATEMRQLGEVLKASSKSKKGKRLVEQIISKEVSIVDAHETLEVSGQINETISKLEKFQNMINDNDFEKTVASSTKETKDKALFIIKRIDKRLSSLLKKLEQDGNHS